LLWRLGLHAALSLSAITLFTLPVLFLGLAVGADPAQLTLTAASPIWSLAILVPGAIGMTLSTWIARRFLDRRSFRSLGLVWNRNAVPDLVVGFAIPSVMMGGIFLAEWGLGWVHFERFAWSVLETRTIISLTLAAFLQFVIAGYQEEILSRGYHLQNFAETRGRWGGVVASSLIFGALHLLNPGSGWGSTLGIFAAGVFLAYGYLRTGQLWLSIGLHAGWNFFEGTVFGFQVSGLGFFHLLEHTVSGPELITGGDFGPESGLIVLPALGLGTALVWAYTHSRRTGSAPSPHLGSPSSQP
jgi:membrane protease YdiL (CAAX protease family)